MRDGNTLFTDCFHSNDTPIGITPFTRGEIQRIFLIYEYIINEKETQYVRGLKWDCSYSPKYTIILQRIHSQTDETPLHNDNNHQLGIHVPHDNARVIYKPCLPNVVVRIFLFVSK